MIALTTDLFRFTATPLGAEVECRLCGSVFLRGDGRIRPDKMVRHMFWMHEVSRKELLVDIAGILKGGFEMEGNHGHPQQG